MTSVGSGVQPWRIERGFLMPNLEHEQIKCMISKVFAVTLIPKAYRERMRMGAIDRTCSKKWQTSWVGVHNLRTLTMPNIIPTRKIRLIRCSFGGSPTRRTSE